MTQTREFREHLPEKPSITLANPISARELLERVYTKRAPDPLAINLDDIPILFSALTYPQDQSTTYIGLLGHTLTGLELNQILYTIAPFKTGVFGLDTKDIISDWSTIVDDVHYAESLRRGHSRIGRAWDLFMEEREFLRQHIADGEKALEQIPYQLSEEDYQSGQSSIIPVMHWQTDKNGRLWLYDKPEEILLQQVEALGFHQDMQMKNTFIHPMVGLFTLALFSPKITDTWPKHMGYVKGSSITQSIGPTQVPVLALMQENNLLDGDIIARAERYISTHDKRVL